MDSENVFPTKRYHAFRRHPQKPSFHISPTGIAGLRKRRNVESTVITMQILTWNAFFYKWHCNFPCEGHHFRVWNRVIEKSLAWSVLCTWISSPFFPLCTFRILLKTRVGVGGVGVGMWWRSLHEHTSEMLLNIVFVLRMHPLPMLRKTRVGVGGVGVGMWWLSLHEHTWEMLLNIVFVLRMHPLPMLRKTWVGVGWVGRGWGCDDVPCTSTHVRCYASMWWVYRFYMFYILSPKVWYH